jgi:uncharacterized protein with von Willebrand factor type A (vWA) domain
MAIHNYRYSQWDGSQNVPDFSADDLLESMADDLLRGGDPEKALRDLLKRGFQLPDGRRFEGMKRLYQQMRDYRQEVFSRYDPNGIVDRVHEQLDTILEWERESIAARRNGPRNDGAVEDDAGEEGESTSTGQPPDGGESGEGQQSARTPFGDQGAPAGQTGQRSQAGKSGEAVQSGQSGQGEQSSESGQGGQQGASGQAGQPGEGGATGDDEALQRMLERMLRRKEEYLDELPGDNTGRIRGLREYDFLSPEARDAFEELIGGMQRDLMEQYFQGMKQGIEHMTPEAMEGVRQMVRDMNDMLEAAQRGDTGAFDRFMEQWGQNFPEGINSLEDLMEHMQRQMSAMQALLDSMDPEQRAELERMMEELLRDDRLQLDLARLGQNLANMGFAPRGGDFPFRGGEAPGFGESLDMMRRLQAMQDLENAMRGGDPFAAMAGAGGTDPSDLFGPNLGGQIQAVKDMAESLLEAGYLKRDGDELTLTARAVRKLGDASLREIFKSLKQDRAGGHATVRKGHGGDILQESRPYQFGDPFHVDIKSTVMNGVYRSGTGTPVKLSPDDFAIFETERSVQHATVLAIDMSRSMFLNDLFIEAKKTALALDSLIRGQFPRDALYLVGFTATAFELQQDDLPRLAENPYSLGTNYEMALALSRKLLSRHRGGNRQILFVTDGEPTACTLPNGQIYFDWPPLPIVEDAALAEAARCAKEGITINSFVLEGYLSYRDRESLRAFVEEMTAVNRGRMFLTGPYHLGEQVLLDYLHGRSMKTLR